METRLVLAYSLIALMIIVTLAAAFAVSRYRRKKRLIHSGRGKYNIGDRAR